MRFPALKFVQRSAIALVSASALLSLFPAVAAAQTGPSISGYSVGSNQTVLTINGSGFGSQTSSDSVTIDGSSATIQSWTDTMITVNLPLGASPGTIDVNAGLGATASIPFSGIERGYYTLSSNGMVTTHGNVKNYGDLQTLGQPTQSPSIQLVPTPDYQGYWILTQNGGVYAFGDATNFGSVGQNITAVSMAILPSGTGAYVLASNGMVYALGSAVNYGSAPSGTTAVSIATTSTGNGYWILATNGTIYSFGDAPSLGSATLPSQSGSTTLSNGEVVRVGNTNPVFINNNGTLYHIPNAAILSGMGIPWSAVQSVPSLNGYSIGLPMVTPYPDGTLLQVNGQNPVYLVQSGVLHWITSESTFMAMGLQWSQIQHVPSLQPNWPVGPNITSPTTYLPNGTLFRIGHTNPVYVVNNGTIQYISSAAVFAAMGYSWSQVESLNSMPNLPTGPNLTSAVPIMTDGSLWRVGNTYPVYLDQNGNLRYVPSLQLFEQLGFSFNQVHSISSISGIPTQPALGTTTIPTTPQTNAVAIVPTKDNQGLWVLFQNGQIATLGNASTAAGQLTPGQLGNSTAIGLSVTPDQGGYTILASDGNSYSFGDALPNSSDPGAVSLAMSAVPQATFISMAYGSFMPHYDGSYSTMVNNAAGISVINPTWYYATQNPTTLAWGLTTPPTGYSNVVAQAHSEGIQVWPMIGSPYIGPWQTDSNVASLVSQIVSVVQQNNYDGITIDFEPNSYGGLGLSGASQQYTYFVSQLGPALHAIGKKLMVDVYASSYPNTVFNYTAIAPYVDYINIMDYPYHNASTDAGATSPVGWAASVVQNAIDGGLSPSQIILGVAPYGHYWTFNNTNGIVGNGDVYDTQAASLLASNPSIVPVWDPAFQSEVFMTNEYLNNNGQWTVNPNGQAVAPTSQLSTADVSQTLPQVKNLQGLLNYILLRYAVENNQPTPTYLIQDGYYGSYTAAAVQQFQQDFNVSGATPGVYDAATQAALNQVIQQWNIGQYQYWIDTTQSIQNRIQQVALAYNLAGIAPWRLPFETPDYWQAIESTVTVSHLGQ